MRTCHALAAVLIAGTATLLAGEAPGWPYYLGPNSNLSATETGVALVDDLGKAALVWKSEAKTPPGAAQSQRYGRGHGWHRISLNDFNERKLPLRDGGTTTSGGGVPLPGGGANSLLVSNGVVYCTYFSPSGDVIDADEAAKRSPGGEGTWSPSYWKVSADDVIVAIDAATGKTRWTRTFADKGMNWCDHKSIITGHTGCVFDGRVYALGSTCRIYCVSASSGAVVWEGALPGENEKFEALKKANLAAKKVFSGMNRQHCNSMGYAGGVLVCPDFNGGIVAFDGANGSVLWKKADCIGKYGTPTRWVHEGQESILVGSPSGTVRCIEPRSGEERWTIAVGSNLHSLPVSGDILICNSTPSTGESLGIGAGQSLRPAGYRMTLTGATKLWQHDKEACGWITDGTTGVPIWKTTGFVRSNSGTTMFDIATGKILGHCAEAKIVQESHGYCAEGRFFHEPDSQHGRIHDVIMTGTAPDTFKPMGTAWTPPHYSATGYEMPMSHPVVGGLIYLRGADGVYCYDLRKR